jgi:hypothetical protein
VDTLINPDLNYNLPVLDEKKKDEVMKEEDMAKTIVQVLSYTWKSIVELIKGGNNVNNNANTSTSLGIYS